MRYARHKNKSVMQTKGRTLLPTILTCIVITLLLVQVAVSNRLATTGVRVSIVEEEIQSLSQQNTNLAVQIASASALMTLKEKAANLGFTKAIKPIYLSQDLPIARGLQ